MTAWLPIILACVTLVSYVLHTYFSDEAAKKVADAKAAAEEKARQDAQAAQLAANQSHAAQTSAGLGNAWDAADQELKKP